jgi:ADP-heptose:LPS heptosyltransferase/glycosyltransferase involved in cell wall biosynthesis
MRVGFVLQDPRRPPSGLDIYTRCLWDALHATESEFELVPVTLPLRFAARAALRTLWEQAYLPRWARRNAIDLLHVPAGSAPALRGVPCVLTLHDLGDEASPAYGAALGPRLYFGRVVPWSARRATAVLTDSEATKRDAVARLGIPEQRIAVAPLAPAPGFKKLPKRTVAGVLERLGLSAPYFLQVGAMIPRKNLAGALAGFAQFIRRSGDEQTQFVAVGGPGAAGVPLSAEAGELARQGRVRVLDHLPQDELVALYNGALAAVLPSYYEGFGLPLVEAFACGIPAIASDVASLPEVAGDAALYIDPREPASIAEAMERYASSPELRGEMARRAARRRRRYSWRRTAQQTLAVYRRALGTAEQEAPVLSSAQPIAVGRPKLLFVRLDGLGDAVLTTPCFRAVKERYPQARVDVVVRPEVAPVLEGHPDVDRVVTLAAPWRARWRLPAVIDTANVLRRLRRERYDFVITPRRDADDAAFARLCGGRRTAGFSALRTRPFLSDRVRFRSERHTAENYLDLATLLGCRVNGQQPFITCTTGDLEQTDALLGEAAGETLVALAPFGSSEAKAWPVARAAALCDALGASGMQVVLLGDGAARNRADALAQRTDGRLINLAGETSIAQLCDVLRRCRLLVCVDSGAMHLAAALGVSTVALFGAEDPALWGPYGDVPHRVVRARGSDGRYSIKAVAVEPVLAAALELLDTIERPERPELARAA